MIVSIDLMIKDLQGPIPDSIANLRHLKFLNLNENQLSGSIPSSLYTLTKLEYLGLSENSFTGSIPAAIGNLVKLNDLYLFHNQLSGPIPAAISNLTNLFYLYMYGNQLTGSIPAAIGDLRNLNYLSLERNKLTGSIPTSISNLTGLTNLKLNDNQLTGSLPGSIGNLKNLVSLDLSSNRLTGPIPPSISGLRNLRILHMEKNELEGSLPGSLFTLTNLLWMELSMNKLAGPVPSTISKLSNLWSLRLHSNQLVGTIPDTIRSLTALVYLSLAYNQLYGTLPASLSQLTVLRECDLSHNYLTGPLEIITEIRMDVANNYLSGAISEPTCTHHNIIANCFALTSACSADLLQRPAAECAAFCGITNTTSACEGHGTCYPNGPSLVPTCMWCDPGFLQLQGNTCIAEEWVNTLPVSSAILPPFTILTKGTKRETAGKFMAKPVTLFAYPPGLSQAQGCGVELAFAVNFTFSLVPESGIIGSNGFAFVIAAKAKNGNHSDVSRQHVGLNINGLDRSLVAEVSPYTLTDGNAYTAWVDYQPGDPGTMRVFLADSRTKPEEPLLQEEFSLCAVLQGGVRQGAFFFGFVASTTEKPFQLHGIVRSAVQTGFFTLKSVRIKEQARGLALSSGTYAPARAGPFLRYVSTDYELASNDEDSWRIRDFHTWNSIDFLGWPVKDQANCNACWAYAVVASIEAAYGIARHHSAPQLSVEPLFAAMGLADQDKCSAGGSPTEAFEKLVALDAGSGLTSATKYPIQGFERTSFKGYVGLMLAVRRQPVVVHIEASADTFVSYDGTFKYQDPECYTGNLNHVVLVVGYFINRNDGSQNRIAPPFWIIRNSWGEEWGDRGHMRMDIQGGDGVCGINVLPGIYPIVKIPGDPCSSNSYRGDQDMSGMNPCGRFRCNAVDDTSYTCTCTIEGAARQPFVEADNGNGASTCAYGELEGSTGYWVLVC
ncbi:unnamed protein product [Closterium sp. Yama58-4]|nr:unnamed protein product [Closterium sp. Yama58-4]